MAFPLPELPGLNGTTPMSDSLQGFSGSRFIITCSNLLALLARPAGSPGLPSNPGIQHAIVSDPGEAVQHLPRALYCVDFRQLKNVILPISLISRLNPFNFRLRPAVLIPLCLTFGIIPAGPGFSIRWLACLAGAGIPPAGLHDLARPH